MSAWMLRRYCHNPTLHVLEGIETSVSWWLHFAGQQLLTLEASRAVQWLVIDFLAQRTPAIRTLTGPLVILLAISGKG